MAPLIGHDLDIDTADPEPPASGDIQAGWKEYGPADLLIEERSPGEPTQDDDG